MKTLSEALTREHREIDTGIAAFIVAMHHEQLRPIAMQNIMKVLRRHIYLEEAIVFPPLRASELFAAILVMLREHGELWRTMDALEPLLAAGRTDPQVAELCAELARLLEAHNTKEESTIYAQLDGTLPDEPTAELREFLTTGTLPADWRCAQA